ncbi:carbohydrate kinase family protein [Streptomyces sp. NPDC088785]|uniref:carbohydrate kinase family protein n=1 Tax=Streptomyces sp. NPDC088785 TaxID=3365897 RepID=UPI003800285A
MRLAVTGSVATDHLAVFPGRFTDHLLADQLDRISLSFLADALEVRRGGVAANITVGLGRLGLRPLLVGAVGHDFADYDSWLVNNGVDTRAVHVSETLHTARFMCTTDQDHNQIATFYAGAMAEARTISLSDLHDRLGPLGLVLIAPDDPEAMLRHTRESRAIGVPFAADPSQQLARLDGPQARELIDGARYLFTNEYEASLLVERTGLDRAEILARVGTWVCTQGAEGADILERARPVLHVPAVPTGAAVDPTGVGDALRAGFLAAVARGLPTERGVQLGCALATEVLESVGTQEYKIDPSRLLSRIHAAYGSVAAGDVAPLIEDLP